MSKNVHQSIKNTPVGYHLEIDKFENELLGSVAIDQETNLTSIIYENRQFQNNNPLAPTTQSLSQKLN